MDSRQTILDDVRRYANGVLEPSPFVAGETYIPPSGKVLDADDAVALIDAGLDLWLTAGRYATEFEAALAARAGTRHARATVSGSAANLLAFSALTSWKLRERAIPKGAEVITVAAGFPTTVAPIVQNGCVPVFCDVTLPNGDVDTDHLERAVSDKTRAIMIAHTLGHPFDLDAAARVARDHGLYLIEDCCDAFGATFDGRPVGTFGDLGTLSFYPAHHVTTGEGGAVFCRNKALITLVESFRDWGRDCWCPPGRDNTCGKRFQWRLGDLPAGYDHKYTYAHLGYNLKMTDMQAAIGLRQLDKLDGFIARRRENWRALRDGLVAEGLEEVFHLPEAGPNRAPSWFGFLMTLRDGVPFTRRQVVTALEARKVGTRLLFAGNLVRQPAFRHVPHRVVDGLEVTDKMMRDSFWIGVWPGIGPAQIAYMIETLRDVVREVSR